MKTRARRLAARVLSQPFFQNRLSSMNHGRARILMYHGFTHAKHRTGLINREGIHLDADRFEEQARYLKQNYQVIPLSRLLEATCGQIGLPPNAAVLTMDDGYESIHSLAFPILQRYNLPATTFITTSFVEERKPLWFDRVEWALHGAPRRQFELESGEETLHLDLREDSSRELAAHRLLVHLKRLAPDTLERFVHSLELRMDTQLDFEHAPEIYRPLTWEQIAEMVDSDLVTIGNHTHSHAVLPRCTEACKIEEITLAHDAIQKRLGISCQTFCYPDGQLDSASKTVLASLGYETAVGTQPGLWHPEMDPLDLPRFAVGPGAAIGEFSLLTNGGLRVVLRTLGGSFLRPLQARPIPIRRSFETKTSQIRGSGSNRDRQA